MKHIELLDFNKGTVLAVQVPMFKGPEPQVIFWQNRCFIKRIAVSIQKNNWTFAEVVAWQINHDLNKLPAEGDPLTISNINKGDKS
jgi:hypothetical protein